MSKPDKHEQVLDELRSELSYALYIGFPTRLRFGIHMPHAIAKNRAALRQTIARIRALDWLWRHHGQDCGGDLCEQCERDAGRKR